MKAAVYHRYGPVDVVSVAGAFTGKYTVRWTDRFGTHSIAVPITGTGVR